MIELSRFNGSKFFLNITHVESVEATPDTVITLFNGKKFVVRDDASEVVQRITAFYQTASVYSAAPRITDEMME
ncbi:flagellar FlbD family protein [Brevibacillus fulvus]|uniref:Flagellar protein FlbD n=1 Tax=Brevibacillus fulvus TaxID=1125967 RepID=A0A938Y3N7_9BACL|nr:flagellar FlbD family protein [Brevibacillus fulvus]MBM7590620.1 flagellar protein FlbD [Brevibacillus fulvus]